MQCLVVGDLHLKSSQSQLTTPNTWLESDVIIFVGDIVDDSAESLETGRELLKELDSAEPETIVVPGNHDFNYYPELTADLSSIRSIHQSMITIDGWSFYGLGSDRFDDGIEVRYPDIPGITDADSDPDQFEQTVADIIEGDTEPSDIVTTAQGTEAVRRSLKLYRDRLDTLDDLAPRHNRTVLVTHLPPFGVGLDRLSARNPRYPDRMLGSIAIRSHIRRASPTYNFCGHIHEGKGTVESDGCLCLNAGKGSSYSLELEQRSLDGISETSAEII